MIRRLLFTIHRVLGTALSILFLMWFISGIVLIYHGYPRFKQQEAITLSAPINRQNLPDIDSLAARLESHGVKSSNKMELSLQTTLTGETYFSLKVDKDEINMLPSGEALPQPRIDTAYLHKVAKLWSPATVQRIDTLQDLDQWTPFSRLHDDLPFYRIKMNEDGRYIYVSSKTGKIITDNTRSERLWAYLGAIPHWIYFTGLRQNAELWSKVVIWLSALGCFMVLTGLYAGIDVYLRTRSKKLRGLTSPYKKRRYRWHHLLGTLGGLFIFTWIFSGMMSLAELPSWVTGVPKDKPRISMEGNVVPLQHYEVAYQPWLSLNGDAKKITWRYFNGHPFYEIERGNEKTDYIDAITGANLNISREEVVAAVQKYYGKTPKSFDLMKHYDGYYQDRKGRLPLPVYKITLDDDYNTTIYFDPATADTRVVDRSSRMNSWAYSKLHRLNFTILTHYPVVWTIVMWTLLLAGAVVSATGVWLGIDYLRRLFRRKPNRRKSKS